MNWIRQRRDRFHFFLANNNSDKCSGWNIFHIYEWYLNIYWTSHQQNMPNQYRCSVYLPTKTVTAELLWKWGGWLVTQSGGAENTFSSVTLYNFQKVGGGGGGLKPPPPAALPPRAMKIQLHSRFYTQLVFYKHAHIYTHNQFSPKTTNEYN